MTLFGIQIALYPTNPGSTLKFEIKRKTQEDCQVKLTKSGKTKNERSKEAICLISENHYYLRYLKI